MPKYRLFCLNADNGRMEPAQSFEAADNRAAIQLAEDLRNKRPAELWRVYKVVKRWTVG